MESQGPTPRIFSRTTPTRASTGGTGGRGSKRDSRNTASRPGKFRRFSVAAALYLAFASCMAFTTAKVLHTRSHPTTLLGGATAVSTVPPKYLVLMVLDGARPDYFGQTALPNFDQLAASGTQYTNGVDGILEAETPAGHTTIATGNRPDTSGILGFDWVNSDNSRYSLFDPAKMNEMEQIIQDNHDSTIGGLYKQKYPNAKVVSMSGSKYYAAAPLGGPNADAIIYYGGVCVKGTSTSCQESHFEPSGVPGHMPPANLLKDPSLSVPTTSLADGQEDAIVTKMAVATVQQMQPRMLLINYPEFDWPLGHVDGGSLDPSKVVVDMKAWDDDLGKIEDAYRKLGILNQTLFVFTADHGMMPITRFVPSTVITNAISQSGTTAPDIATNSADYVWIADPTKAQAVADNIMNAKDPGIQCAYYLSTPAGHGPGYTASQGCKVSPTLEVANQYLLSALLNGHEPHVVVFGNEGASFSDPASTHWKGDHGGASWESQHFPLIMAGPGVKSGQTITSPVQLEDIAPTVLTAMGVTPTGMHGNVLTDALLQTKTTDQTARAGEIKQLTPIVQALSHMTPMINTGG
jgi:predicted AlkP superfamily pyrophosphatase or phosphodiesterase